MEVKIPKYEELSVSKLYNDFMTLEGVRDYFPDTYPKGTFPDR